MEEILKDKEASSKFDKEIMETMKHNVDIGWFFAHGMFTFGAKSPTEFLRMVKPYNMIESAPKIRARMLVINSEDDKSLLPDQPQRLYDAITSPKEFMVFTKEEGAAEHCQMGAVMISNAGPA